VSAIVIDTSALMGLLLQESDSEALLDAAARAAVVRLSAASRLELALMPESARHGIEATEVEQLLLALRVEVMPFDQHQLHGARVQRSGLTASWLRLQRSLLGWVNDFHSRHECQMGGRWVAAQAKRERKLRRHSGCRTASEMDTARLFQSGCSQAVRCPPGRPQ